MEPLKQEKRPGAALLQLLLIVLLSGLAYLNSLKGSFHFDDGWTIVNNAGIRELTDLRRIAASQPTRPVLMFTFALNYHFGGMEVFGYHLVNLLLHVAVSLLVYRLAALIFFQGQAAHWGQINPLGARASRPQRAAKMAALPGSNLKLTQMQAASPGVGGSLPVSHLPLLAALLFALHPIHTEAVSYISSRSSVLCAFFYLSSLLLFDRASRPTCASRPRAHALLAGSTFVPLTDAAAEHRLYLPGVGFALFSALILAGLACRAEERLSPQRAREAVAALCVGLLLAYTLGTVGRNATYRDEVALWEDATQKSPFKARPHTTLAMIYLEEGRVDEAIRELETALKSEPDFISALNTLGWAYSLKGMFDRAILEYQKALRIDPRYAQAHNNLGLIFYKMGRLDEAIAELQRALELDPANSQAENNLLRAIHDKNRRDGLAGVPGQTSRKGPRP